MLLQMVFKDNYWHGDLHPGNILVTHTSQVLYTGHTYLSGTIYWSHILVRYYILVIHTSQVLYTSHTY